MRDLEAEMAKALEGQFFWEHTATPEVFLPPEMRQIVIAQRNIYKPKKTAEEKRIEKENRLKEIVAQKEEEERLSCRVSYHFKSDIKNFIEYLAEVVAKAHNVPTEEVRSKARGPRVTPVKHHFVWAFMRYFPKMSISEFSRLVGKDRATLYHSDEMFESMRGDYEAEIAAVDKIVGYLP